MLETIKRALSSGLGAAGYSMIETPVLDDLKRKAMPAEEMERKIAETMNWAADKEKEIQTKIDETKKWAEDREKAVEAKVREATAWAGLADAPAALGAAGSPLTPVGVPLPMDVPNEPPPEVPLPGANRLAQFDALLKSMRPWSGRVPKGFFVDFLGVLTDTTFTPGHHGQSQDEDVTASVPGVADGEGWFEMVDWIVSAREATESYVAVSLGASYGAQVVGPWKALKAVNDLPARLVAVEAVPENCAWIRRHMTNNGIDPNDHTIVQAAIGPDNEPALFPTGAPGSGRNNCVATNSAEARQTYAHLLRRQGYSERVLQNLLIYNSTGITRDLGGGYGGEVKFVSSVTLADVLSPFQRVDLLEVDIQQSEINVIPPFMDLLNRKVRRAHLGTHGRDVHQALRLLFFKSGWEVVFDYAPDSHFVTEFGAFDTSDGVLTVRNPRV